MRCTEPPLSVTVYGGAEGAEGAQGMAQGAQDAEGPSAPPTVLAGGGAAGTDGESGSAGRRRPPIVTVERCLAWAGGAGSAVAASAASSSPGRCSRTNWSKVDTQSCRLSPEIGKWLTRFAPVENR